MLSQKNQAVDTWILLQVSQVRDKLEISDFNADVQWRHKALLTLHHSIPKEGATIPTFLFAVDATEARHISGIPFTVILGDLGISTQKS